MIEFHQDVRGLPLWLLREYLLELGGQLASDGTLKGDGWRASLTQLEDDHIGVIHVGRVRLEVSASPTAWKHLRPALEKKLLRAGG